MIHFIGIKGTGMSALACMLYDMGEDIQGSDLKKHFFTEDPLVDRKIPILEFDKDNIKDHMTVIIGNAFLEDFGEVIAARANKTCQVFRYHEYLGHLMEKYQSFSVAGSHGKTTTTGLLSAMLNQGFPTAFLIGDGTGFLDEKSEKLVVESCEYRRHFLAYYPDYAIITNIEIDHVDYFKSTQDYLNAYLEFSNNVKKAIMVFGDDEETRKFKSKTTHYFYGLGLNNDLVAKNLVELENAMSFDVYFLNEFIGHFNLPFVGRHMLYNSLACIGLGILNHMSVEAMIEGLNQFKGVKRRYVIEHYNDCVFVDDYAHHPTEILMTIEATKKRFPNKKVVAIFKPHRVSRVFYFKEEFKAALSLADEVYLCDFTSIDDKEDGIDIDITYLQKEIENAHVLAENDEGAKTLAQYHDAVLLFMSSKDIYDLANLVKRYQNP
ncbi:MAG: UDP-N-acetylmuramate--L-alanine ligase [Erysipelotrichaceae bacterium]